jgi:hypothetical protein
MCNPPLKYRSSSLSLRSVFRLASLFCVPLVALSLAVVTLGLPGPAAIAQNIFNCSSFSSSGACDIPFQGGDGQRFYSTTTGSISGGVIDFVPVGNTHSGSGIWYQTPVNVQAFTTTFSFVPNGYNFAFVVQNSNNIEIFNTFTGGAGAEGGFSQFAGGGNIAPNHVFALEFDSYSSLTNSSGTFSYSSAQIYQTLQAPYMPNSG